MKHFFLILLLSSASISHLPAQSISLLQAAELATKFMKEQKIEGSPIQELFAATALRRVPAPESSEPTTVAWKVELEETSLERTTEATNAIITVDGKKYRRVVEIRNDQSAVMGTVYAEPRQMVVRPRIVPAAK